MRLSRSYHGIEYREIRYQKPYGFLSFMGDLFMLFLTGGLWFIWIFVREMRRR